jgi:hypothetical protein
VTTDVSGSAELADGGRRWYQSDEHGPAGQVVDRYATTRHVVERFIADGVDGYLHLSVTEQVPHTSHGTAGGELEEHRPTQQFLTVFRKGNHGAALFEYGTPDTDHRQWITVGIGLGVPGWTTGWLDYEGPIPDEAVLSADLVHEMLREFLDTNRRPTCVRWRELTVPTWQAEAT